jgi:CRP-like cAMP-binding protein
MRPAKKIDVAQFLAQLPIFNDLDQESLTRLAQHATQVHAPKGHTLFHRGDPCDGLHLVVYGRVKLAFVSAVGSEKVVEIIGPGHSFGEAVMFMNKPYAVTAQTLEDSFLIHVGKHGILHELDHIPRFALKMLGGLSRRLHSLICDVEAYSTASGTQRVIGYLLKENLNDGEQVTLNASKLVVASRLNLTPEHFSRILHDLSEQKLIEVHGRGITILSVERLRTYQK